MWSLFRVFCNCFFSVSLDFLLLKEQVNMKGSKRNRSLDACSSAFIAFLEIIVRSFCSTPFETTFLTYKYDIDYSRDFLRIINNYYIEYCNKKIWKMNIKSFLLVLKSTLAEKYPDLKIEFYVSWQNCSVYMGLN